MRNKTSPSLLTISKSLGVIFFFLLNGDGFSGRKIKKQISWKCDDGLEVSKGINSKEWGEWLPERQWEWFPDGNGRYPCTARRKLCRGQQRSFKERLDGFVQFNPLDGVNVVSEFHTGHKGQVCVQAHVRHSVRIPTGLRHAEFGVCI